MNDSIKMVLNKMCEVVGADFDSIDFKKDRWYYEYEWTSEQEYGFTCWLGGLINANAKVRKEITNFPNLVGRSKKRSVEVAKEFVSVYGWKIKQGEN